MGEPEYAPSPWEFVADHVERYLASDGEDGYEMEGAPCVILTTTGRRTGKVRRTPLIRVHDGEHYLVVASLGGAPQHPVWYLNLMADPEVTLQDRGVVHELVARTASPEEKARLAGRSRRMARLRELPGRDRPRHSAGGARSALSGRVSPCDGSR
ncbi:MAG: nitroreductase family deazaflavin-dependent oxidoreductase [Acidimicrobiales bacterium]|nr:nitroreductase family deazaflavin-dependent oxidoreductase [Acidimicrobiales bacterium]